MLRFALWLSILAPSMAVIAGVVWGSFALGVPGEWTWGRVTPTLPLWLALVSLLIAAALYLGFVWIGAQRVERSRLWEMPAWIFGLTVCGFAWLWIAQEAAPENYQLSKAVWVLYFRGSSGYFSEANDAAGDLTAYLAGYERKMAEGDVLHIGTHPPGLIVALRLLSGLCREFPAVVDTALATQSDSVRAAFSGFNSTSDRPRSLSKVERAVLWLAFLLVQAGTVLTVVPLFGLLRMTCSRRASWLAVAFWPTMPALALFLPKADCIYPLFAMAFLWLWLTAITRRSRVLALLAGFVLWVSLTMSLAFLPIALVALLAGLYTIASELPTTRPHGERDGDRSLPGSRFELVGKVLMSARGLLRPAGWGASGFVIPCLATGWFLKLNLLRVWWMNLQNHAGFYSQYPRTYWKWLMVNPIELTVSAGIPLAVLAIWSIARQCRTTDIRGAAGHEWARFNRAGANWTWLVTFGLLWLSGKNMGEAARLWILLMPFLVWSAGPLFELQGFESAAKGVKFPFSREGQSSATFPAAPLLSENAWCVALAVQLITTAAIVTHVAGFHYPITTI
jgi:hypothetical protein